MKRVTKIISSREVDRAPARTGGLVNRAVDGGSIQSFSIPSSPKVPHIAENRLGRVLSGVLRCQAWNFWHQSCSDASTLQEYSPPPLIHFASPLNSNSPGCPTLRVFRSVGTLTLSVAEKPGLSLPHSPQIKLEEILRIRIQANLRV